MSWKNKLRRSEDNTSVSSNTGAATVSSSSATAEPRGNSTFYSPTTSLNPLSASPSLSISQVKPVISFATLHTSAQQWAYQRGAQSAATTTKQIEADMMEVRNIIANYAVEPLEILHLVDRWLQQLLYEFRHQRDHFKYQLGEKWRNQELIDIKYDDNARIRKIYTTFKDLEEARDVTLSRETFDELNTYLGALSNRTSDDIKERFNLLSEDYFKIIQCLEFIDTETKTASVDDHLNVIKKQLMSLKKLHDKESHTICIVGLEKAGKSTFINALLGYELLPTASERCTQVRTVLKPPLENGDRPLFGTVKFYDDQEFDIFFNKMTRKTDENEQQLLQRKDEVFRKREMSKNKFPEEHFYITGSSDIQTERATIIKQLNNYITGELYVNIIKEVAIYTNKLPGKNYELLDVPGFDSPIKEHRDAGLAAIKSADAFLFLTNGQQPSLTEPQINLLQEIQQNHFEAMQRAFGIITKLDLCQTATIYQEHHRKTFAELVDKRFRHDRIYVTCPRIQIINENSEEFHVIHRKLHSFGDELVYGFQRSKDALNDFIEYELPKTHLKQLIDLGRVQLVRHVVERLDKIKDKQLLPQNLAMKSIDDYIVQQNTESWDRIYYKNIFQPVFEQANCWHTMIVTKERAAFIHDVKQKFRDSFLDLSKEFIQRTFPIEHLVFEKHDVSKLQLNVHPIDNSIREKLSIELENIVDITSDILAQHLYHKYVCELENLLNNICPQLKDLYRTKLTLEKCRNETHALILRVCRPVIVATLRYSHLDLSVKQDAITELIYIAPTVAFNIANIPDQDGTGELLGSQILASAETLADKSGMTTSIIRTLFKT